MDEQPDPGETKICRDCGDFFVFTPGEKRFFDACGFSPPTRCPVCRAERREARDGRRRGDGAERGSVAVGRAGGDRRVDGPAAPWQRALAGLCGG
jgi:hypothetical protein